MPMMHEAKISSLVSLFPLPQYVVVLEDTAKTRLVPIWIGVNEGNAIALEMNGEKFPRPLTHDLIINIVSTMGGKIEKIVINDIKDNSYFAQMTVSVNGKKCCIDARPSDSLAMAVRAKCPIYIDDRVLNKCPRIEKPISETDIDKFKKELKHMTPEEFFKKLETTPGKKKDIEDILGPQGLAPNEDDPDEDDPEDEIDDKESN
jgi:uncharacterized protein